MRMRLAALVVLIACLAALPAAAHDSDAPPGAPHSWLPKADWVMEHWVPLDESRLHALRPTDDARLKRWLRDDHHTIAMLAERRKGLDADTLADQLVEPQRGKVS